jgi:hypothetical protein
VARRLIPPERRPAICQNFGNRYIQSTAIYTAMSPERFKGWEKD